YVEASQRLWQMEFYARAAAGRLSEVLGPTTLENDKWLRRHGLAYGATNSLEVWKQSPEDYAIIEAYSEGVNAYIQSLQPADYPVEYKLLDYAPEEWSPLKTCLIQKFMALTLCAREDDLENTNLQSVLGKQAFDYLFPEWYEEQSPIIPRSREWDFEPVALPTTDSTTVVDGPVLSSRMIEKQDKGIGSNNWAVGPSKTASGNPILCNDPHLRLTVPSIWFESHLNGDDLNVYGVSLPGAPGIIIGFNDHIAWGVTNVGWDVLDWYKISWKEDDKTKYLLDGEYVDADIVVEEFIIKGQESVYDTVYYTHWGPVMYNEKNHPYQDLAMKWQSHKGSNDMSTFVKLNYAKNYDEYKAALGIYENPAQNFVFASREDQDIALWVQGKFPLRARQQGRFVQDGSTTASNWQGYIPRDHNPHVKNPERDFVSSANQHSTGPEYPYYYIGGFEDYRGRWLNRRLAEMENITMEDMRKLQNDNHSLKAEEAMPLFLQYLDRSVLSKEEVAYLNQVEDWDYKHEAGDVAPSVFSAWFSAYSETLWDEIDQYADSLEVMRPEWFRSVFLLRDNPNDPYFDRLGTEAVETGAVVVTAAFQKACSDLKEWSEKNDKEPIWRDFKGTNISHLISALEPFSITNVNVGGDRSALNAVSKVAGPSWRMIVELGEEIKAVGVYPGGQSGNPGSPYYDNFIESWAKGEYYPLQFSGTPESIGDMALAHLLFTSFKSK
ncbi:MAG: penicillin acylase family protein, partial [Bacteroidota bacterium]